MKNYNLDQTDFGILRLLQQDGLMTYKDLADKLMKTITPIVERVKRLRELGYIKNTVAIVDIHKIRTAFVAYPHILLTQQTEDILSEFKSLVIQCPEVMECYHLTGSYDFMLKIVLPDMASYNDFLRKTMSTLPYIASIQSFMVLSEFKHETAYPI